MTLRWQLWEGTLGEESPTTVALSDAGVLAIVLSVHDPEQPGRWRAAEHGEQKSQGAGFHATVEPGPVGAAGDVVTIWFDGRLREERVRIAYALVG